MLDSGYMGKVLETGPSRLFHLVENEAVEDFGCPLEPFLCALDFKKGFLKCKVAGFDLVSWSATKKDLIECGQRLAEHSENLLDMAKPVGGTSTLVSRDDNSSDTCTVGKLVLRPTKHFSQFLDLFANSNCVRLIEGVLPGLFPWHDNLQSARSAGGSWSAHIYPAPGFEIMDNSDRRVNAISCGFQRERMMRKLSVETVSELSGVSIDVIIASECEAIDSADLWELARLAAFYGVTFAQLERQAA